MTARASAGASAVALAAVVPVSVTPHMDRLRALEAAAAARRDVVAAAIDAAVHMTDVDAARALLAGVADSGPRVAGRGSDVWL